MKLRPLVEVGALLFIATAFFAAAFTFGWNLA